LRYKINYLYYKDAHLYITMWLEALFIQAVKIKVRIRPKREAHNRYRLKLKHGADVADYDGNTCHTIIIDNQTWLAENLEGTQYDKGDKMTKTNHGACKLRALTVTIYIMMKITKKPAESFITGMP